MEAKDFLETKALLGGENHGLTQYEQIKVGRMNQRAGGTAIAGLVVGVGAAVASIGVAAWATAKASEARRVASAENAGTAALLGRLAQQLDAEHTERVAGDVTLNQTITDTVSGSQQGSLTAQQQAELAASQTVMTGLMTGRYSENPQRVALYQDARPCACPASGCGCGCNG